MSMLLIEQKNVKKLQEMLQLQNNLLRATLGNLISVTFRNIIKGYLPYLLTYIDS